MFELIPKEWEVCSLSEIAIIYNGNSINKTEKQEKYTGLIEGRNYIATKDVDFDGRVVYENGVKIPFSETKFKTAPIGSIFVCSEGGSAGKKTAFITQEVCFGNKLYAIVNSKNKFDGKYLYYYTRYNEFFEQFKSLMSGIIGGVGSKRFGEIQIPLPSVSEQERIVASIEELFSELDSGVETLQKVKEQLKVYRQAVLKEAFRDFNKKEKIRNISSVVTSGSRGWAKYYSDIGARFIRITDLTRDKIILKNDSIQRVNLPENVEGRRSKLMENDVLVSITADLGSIALIPKGIEEAYINQHIAMIRFHNQIQGEFMAWYLKSDYGQKDLLKNKRGGGKLGLGLDDIRDTPVPVVTDEIAIGIGNKIDSKMSVCDGIEQTVEIALHQADALKQSILKKAFEGGL